MSFLRKRRSFAAKAGAAVRQSMLNNLPKTPQTPTDASANARSAEGQTSTSTPAPSLAGDILPKP